MTIFLIRRLIHSIALILIMSMIVFAGVYAIGNPVNLLISPDATPLEREHSIQKLGLDQSLWNQYLAFLKGALQGDIGNSFIHNTPAIKLILQRFPATLELAVLSMALAVFAGIPLGMWAGIRYGSLPDRIIMTGSVMGFSLPSFWVGLMMILFFSLYLGWLPTFGRGQTVNVFGLDLSMFTVDGIKHLILPVINLSLLPLSLIIRLTRSGVQEVWPLDFIKFARSKGISSFRLICVHVLKNILIPVVTVTGIHFGTLLAFAVVTETVFSWPGMGKLIIDAITLLDRPVIVAYLVVTVIIFVLINLITDIIHSLLDPRIRIEEQL
ncbi:Peptide ABC transporter, permease protein MetI-like [Desulfonema limicola]|uniref:Peptide ABC transporter, permease protein MetI-like n=1 Tax=Desulfonema limicola TaxID=45656 RepID=A0A975BCR9_9BACT|nr:ABC transporter permease [Desulfonema limicola]QTA82910.1 Peptide ABC transporter, permease protein MetI-like [Desulfonema limicola]